MNKTSFEVEVKIPVGNLEQLGDSLEHIGAERLNSETQIDTYYDHPCRAFQQTDEAIRLRSRIPYSRRSSEPVDESRPLYELTYKGSKFDPSSKTRVELSVGLDELDIAKSILTHLGFKPVAEIVKKRVFYSLDDLTLSLDDIERVGEFLELERVVTSKNEIEPVRAKMFQILIKLGLDPEASIRESYLELFLEK
ncbi:MAG: class IV adenylate cyclase [Candidatus Thorarchaeota archaeon]